MNKKKTGFIANNLFMLKEVMDIIPLYAVFLLSLTVARALINAYLNVYLIKYVVDAIQSREAYETVFFHVVIAMTLFILQKACESIFNNIGAPRMKQRLNYKMQLSLFEKGKELDIENYDKTDFYNDFVLSMSSADTKAIEVIDTINDLLYNIISIFAMVTLIASIDITGLVFALVNVVAAYFLNIRTARVNYKKNLELIPPGRMETYVGRIFYLPEYAKEIRMSNIKKVLLRDLDDSIEETRSIIKKYARELTILNFSNYGFFRTFLMRGVYLIIIVYKLVISKTITFGSFMALFKGSWEFKNSIEAIINIVPRLVDNSLYIDKYKAFRMKKSTIRENSGDDPLPGQAAEIVFRNVSFRYSDESPYILKNVNLCIRPGEKIAIYGLNGAGKSTLIKLLLRLYPVSAGEILLGGKNINCYSLNEYYHYIGVIFQDFRLFAFSIAENVLLDSYDPSEEERIKELLAYVGFGDKYERTQRGVTSAVSREFDREGINFSGGEQQKIALARTIARDYSVVVYDEPASALDPISEYEINKAIWLSSKDKTVICISHRINTNVKADRTIYMREGQVVENDEELEAIYQIS